MLSDLCKLCFRPDVRCNGTFARHGSDLHPNATHWRDADGTWCYAAFLRWYDARELFINRSDKSWPHSYWWFAGRRKSARLAP